MFDLICTFYNYKELERQINTFENSKYKPAYICNWKNENDIDNLGAEVYWLDYNPNKHLGAYGLASSALPLINNEYVLHYHADIQIHDLNLLEKSFINFKNSNKHLAGIPRQWVFNSEGEFINNKSLPFRSEYFFIRSNLYKQVFNFNRLNEYKEQCVKNGHPSLHFEPLIYAACELNGVNFNEDIYYLEDIKHMKELYGDSINYYNIKFENTQIERIK